MEKWELIQKMKQSNQNRKQNLANPLYVYIPFTAFQTAL